MTSSGLFYIQPAADKRSKRDRKQDAKAAINGLQGLRPPFPCSANTAANGYRQRTAKLSSVNRRYMPGSAYWTSCPGYRGRYYCRPAAAHFPRRFSSSSRQLVRAEAISICATSMIAPKAPIMIALNMIAFRSTGSAGFKNSRYMESSSTKAVSCKKLSADALISAAMTSPPIRPK